MTTSQYATGTTGRLSVDALVVLLGGGILVPLVWPFIGDLLGLVRVVEPAWFGDARGGAGSP